MYMHILARRSIELNEMDYEASDEFSRKSYISPIFP